jgi:adenylate cyclase
MSPVQEALIGASAHPVRSLQNQLLGVFDLSGFIRAIHGMDDARIADAVDTLYGAIGQAVTSTGGRVVKYLGDGGLAVWPPEQADAAVAAALAMRAPVAAALLGLGVRTELVVRFHAGQVMAGEFGPDREFDVVGPEVFVAFRLPARTISLSAEAFRLLGSNARAGLKKHTEPVVYIPSGDPRP